jgi:CBS domain-containing protein
MSTVRTRQRSPEATGPMGITELVIAADVMFADPPHCLGTQSLEGVIALMREAHCDTVAVVDSFREQRPIGVVNRRDIAVRCFRDGNDDAMRQSVGGCMSTPIVAVFLDTSVADCTQTMSTNELRSIPVIDRDGHLRGVVCQSRA